MTVSKTELGAYRANLGVVSHAYMQQARALSYGELLTRQGMPWANIHVGVGGIVTALWRSGQRRHASLDLERARRWVSVMKRSRSRGAFWIPELARPAPSCSLYRGPDGIHWLGLLVARERSAPRLRSFFRRCRRFLGGASEIFMGVAGYLTALLVLHRSTGEPSILRVADELALDLLERADDRRGWIASRHLGFSHGRAGTFHALLSWSLARGRALSAGFAGHLDRLAWEVERSGTMGA